MRTTTKNGGRYYIVDETIGTSLPSVTTILGSMTDKSGLDAWKKSVGEEKAAAISKFSANRGTFMHTLHEQYLNFLFITPVENPLQRTFQESLKLSKDLTKEEIECGKDLFMQFQHGSDFYERIGSILFQEVPVWSLKGGGYAGRLDLSIKSKDLKPKIIDFKTSKRPKKEEWIKNYKMQTAAYSVAMFERYGIFPESNEIWISCETGEVQMFEMDKAAIKQNFEEFFELVKGYHQKIKHETIQ